MSFIIIFGTRSFPVSAKWPGITLRDSIWYANSRCGEANCKLLYSVYFTVYFTKLLR